MRFNRGEPQSTASVRDVWQHHDLGEIDREFASQVARHGVRFVRIAAP